jgi:hypothetical protein
VSGRDGGGLLWPALTAVVLVVLELVVFGATVTERWAERVRTTEAAWLERWLGQQTATRVVGTTRAGYETLFVESGLVAWSYAVALPTAAEEAAGRHLSPVAVPWFFGWLEGRLDLFWGAVLQVLQRVVMVTAWWPFLALLLSGTLIEGRTRRRIKQEGFAYASPVRHRGALWTAIALVMAGTLGLLLPLPIPAITVPVLASVVALALTAALAHSQKRL